jgi:hypothetical protein
LISGLLSIRTVPSVVGVSLASREDMTVRFLILLASADHFDTWDQMAEGDRQRHFRDYRAFAEEVRRVGQLVVGDALERPERGSTIREGRVLSDGPYADTVEQLGGFYVIDVDNLHIAVDVASLLPHEYTIEVRPTLGVQV